MPATRPAPAVQTGKALARRPAVLDSDIDAAQEAIDDLNDAKRSGWRPVPRRSGWQTP